MTASEYIPFRDIPAALQIREGDVVLLTSDILKLAINARKKEKDFTADTFIDAFIRKIGPEGTLLIPSYNFDLEDGDVYSVRETQPMTGSLALAAMNRPDFVRTANPLHSFLVCGKHREALAGLNNRSSFGGDSPFAFLHEHDATMIFAGTSPAEAMTFTHYVEESNHVGYRQRKEIRLQYTGSDGLSRREVFSLFSKKAGYTMCLDRLEAKLPGEVMEQKYINGVPFYILRCKPVFDVLSKDIRENAARSVVRFDIKLYFRDIIKQALLRFSLFRTTYGKIRSGKRLP